jgi:aromatic-L-amino-acid/L-tryptophan decarboxylase
MSDSFHMTPEEFRRHGHAVVEWIANYMASVGRLPVASSVRPGDIGRLLAEHAPEEPEKFEDILADLDAVVMPGITNWQSPGWFAYYPANTSGPSTLAEFVSAALGVQGMIWASSPACTEIESRVVDWLVDLLGLPRAWKVAEGPGGGVIQTSASDATHLVHVVARIRASSARIDGAPFVSYASIQAHSSVEKAARVAGISYFRSVGVDADLAMRPRELAGLIAADVQAGLHPLIVTSCVGTTGTAAVDPIADIGTIAREFGLWHHVDAAYAGSAMICPEMRVRQRGVDTADSYTFNPHKWMFTNFDCNVLYVADRRQVTDAMSITPPYLANAATQSGTVVDYRDWQVPLGRRFRALKLWWVLRSYGASGIRHHIREHMRLARKLGDHVMSEDCLELVAPVSFGLVSFRHRSGNAATQDLLDAINADGSVYVTSSVLDGTLFIRVSVGQAQTSQAEVDYLWNIIAQWCSASHVGS